MYIFQELKKAAKQVCDGKELKLAILGNNATQMLATAIKGYARKEMLNLSVYDTDYNQIDAQLIDDNSEVYEYKPDFILLYIATEKIYEEFLDMPIEARGNFADLYIQKIKNYWNMINNHSNCKILQFGFVEMDDRAFGNYANKVSISFLHQMRKLTYYLIEEEGHYDNVYPVELSYLQNRYGRKFTFDNQLYYTAKMTLSFQILPYVAKQVIGIVKATQGKIKKCIVLDLDNTLWGGVIGDDGLGNIEIGELGRGHAFTNLQRWLKQLRERGVLLAVCSKNDENNAKEPFEKHCEMVLRLDDISAFVANWNDKASNIQYIQESLNIGMDSFVFVDDNAFERNLVGSKINEIAVPEIPEDPAEYLDFIQDENYFETISYSDVDMKRTSQYKQEFERKELQMQFNSIDDYLQELEMVGEVKPFDELHYSRIAQLTQRSNQFNLRTIRYTEDDIKRLADSDNYITIYFTLKDKFGDHGLISVMVLQKLNSSTLFVDTWLMSCRVLKRGMEEYIINNMIEIAQTNGFEKIIGEYIPTPKNNMVKDIYEKMGFKKVEDHKFEVECNTYKMKQTFIK